MQKPAKKSALRSVHRRRRRTGEQSLPSHRSRLQLSPNLLKRTSKDTKQARVIAMLQSPSGATVAAIMQQTGWQPHSVRGFLAGVIRKKLKLTLHSTKVDGQRVYRIEGDGQPAAASVPSSRRRAA